jgi:hypothetical protein
MRCAPGMTLLMAAWAAVAVAGCCATHATTGPVTASRTSRERAVADAAAILKAFAVPPGARRLQRAPDALKAPITILISTTLVDDVSFWRAPGQPQAVLAWEQAHLPSRFTPGDQDFGPPSWDRMFELPPVPGVLNARDLVVEVRSGQWADRDPGGRPGELAAAPPGPGTGAIRRPRGHDHSAAQPGPARQAPARACHDHRPGGRAAARRARRQPPAVDNRGGPRPAPRPSAAGSG